jgi:hypothetical protein
VSPNSCVGRRAVSCKVGPEKDRGNDRDHAIYGIHVAKSQLKHCGPPRRGALDRGAAGGVEEPGEAGSRGRRLLLIAVCAIRLYQGETSWWWVVLFTALVAYVFGGMIVWDIVTNPD